MLTTMIPLSQHTHTHNVYANTDDGEIFYGYLFSYAHMYSVVRGIRKSTCAETVGKKVLVVVISQIETSISCKI